MITSGQKQATASLPDMSGFHVKKRTYVEQPEDDGETGKQLPTEVRRPPDG
jgi:hypothetical protein